MKRNGFAALAALLGAVGVIWFLQRSASEDSPVLEIGAPFDEAIPSEALMPAGPGLAGGAENTANAPSSAAQPEGEPVRIPAGPGELLVLSAEIDAPLAEALVQTADETPLGESARDGLVYVEHVPADGLEVRVTRAGFLPASVGLKPGRRIEVVLVPGVAVAGRIVRAGAHGSHMDPGISTVFVFDEDLRELLTTFTTDEAGRFAISAVRPNRPLLLTVHAPDLVPQTQRVVVDLPTSDLVVVVGAGGHLSGRVLDGRGTPKPDMEVRLLPRGEVLSEQRVPSADMTRAERARIVAATPTTRTDERGHYAFAGIARKRAFEAVAVLQPRCEARSQPVWFEKVGERAERDIRIPDMTSLRIRVEDLAGDPRDDVTLHLAGPSGHWKTRAADTWIDGELLLEHLTPGPVTVTATRPGEPTHSEPVELVAGQEATVTIVFPTGQSVRGLVRDKNGDPIAKARVFWVGDDDEGDRVEVLAASDGSFHLRGTSATGTLTITARDLVASRFGFETRILEDVVAGARPLLLTLKDGTRATGVFEGLPADAHVSYRVFPGEPDEKLLELDEDLRFVCRGPPAGRGALFVFRTRGFPPLLHSEGDRFVSEEIRDLGPLTFEATGPRQGRVLDERGKPVWAAKVTVDAPWSNATQRTDREGNFEFVHLPRTWVRVRIAAEGYPPSRTYMGKRSEDVRQDLRLWPHVGAKFEILDEQGKPVGPAELAIEGLGEQAKYRRRQKTNATGRLRSSLRPGRYRVSVQARTESGTRLHGESVIEITTQGPQQDVRLTIRAEEK